jgi:hypothetical protein
MTVAARAREARRDARFDVTERIHRTVGIDLAAVENPPVCSGIFPRTSQ